MFFTIQVRRIVLRWRLHRAHWRHRRGAGKLFCSLVRTARLTNPAELPQSHRNDRERSATFDRQNEDRDEEIEITERQSTAVNRA